VAGDAAPIKEQHRVEGRRVSRGAVVRSAQVKKECCQISNIYILADAWCFKGKLTGDGPEAITICYINLVVCTSNLVSSIKYCAKHLFNRFYIYPFLSEVFVSFSLWI